MQRLKRPTQEGHLRRARDPTRRHAVSQGSGGWWDLFPRLSLQEKFYLLCGMSFFGVIFNFIYLPTIISQATKMKNSEHGSWAIGMSRVDITPTERVWLSGFASRNRTVDSTALLDPAVPLLARAIDLRYDGGISSASDTRTSLLLVTLDVIGIDRALSDRIYHTVEARYGLSRERLRIVSSHTHTGPVVCNNLFPLAPTEQEEQAKVLRFCDILFEKVVACVGEALSGENVIRATAHFAKGSAELAVNRRQILEATFDSVSRGLVDEELPVLWFQSVESKRVVAGVYGFAAHATILTSTYEYSGDYPGVASAALEKKFPGSSWMYLPGCGGDLNIYPRGTTRLLSQHATSLAQAVSDVVMKQSTGDINASFSSVRGNVLSARHAFVKLPFRKQLGVKEVRKMQRSAAPTERKTLGFLLRSMGGHQLTAFEYDYPLSVWHLGTITMVFLGGEPTVGYAHRLRRELGVTWVIGYSDDVMGYVGTAEVLREGNREGSDRAAWYYGLPSAWHTDVEDAIVNRIRDML